jgi:hypothetical protein
MHRDHRLYPDDVRKYSDLGVGVGVGVRGLGRVTRGRVTRGRLERRDRLERGMGRWHVVDAENAGTEPRADRERRDRAFSALVDAGAEGLPDEALVGHRDEHRPAGRGELAETPGAA